MAKSRMMRPPTKREQLLQIKDDYRTAHNNAKATSREIGDWAVETGPAKLIVVPTFVGEAVSLSVRVQGVFEEFDVETFGEEMIDVLVEEIAFSAH